MNWITVGELIEILKGYDPNLICYDLEAKDIVYSEQTAYGDAANPKCEWGPALHVGW